MKANQQNTITGQDELLRKKHELEMKKQQVRDRISVLSRRMITLSYELNNCLSTLQKDPEKLQKLSSEERNFLQLLQEACSTPPDNIDYSVYDASLDVAEQSDVLPTC